MSCGIDLDPMYTGVVFTFAIGTAATNVSYIEQNDILKIDSSGKFYYELQLLADFSKAGRMQRTAVYVPLHSKH